MTADRLMGDAPSRVLIEICVDDLAGAVAAERAGADRVELCADLLEGGTTPSVGMLVGVLASVRRVGVQVMVRPRGGGFVLDADDRRVMLADIARIRVLAEGAAVPVGLVLGALTPDARVDETALDQLLAAAGPLPVTFHRAFDETRDLGEAYETLRAHGITRVLTSGGAPTARDGAAVLASLVARAGDGPNVLAAGTVRAENVAELVARTGVREVHLRAQVPSPRADGTLSTDENMVRAVVEAAGPATASGPHGPAADVNGVLAIDVGGTSLKGALVDATGAVRLIRTVPTGTSSDETLQRVRALAAELKRAAARTGLAVCAAGVVAPGLIDEDAGVVRYASTLGWRDVPLKRLLTEDLGLPVAVGHDVRAAGLAEQRFGDTSGRRDAVVVAIGTGVAAALLVDDRIVTGALSAAGELGHIPVRSDGERCTCGQDGCLEVYMSGAGLARRYRRRRPGAVWTAADIVAHLDDDPVAREVWSDGVDALARGIVTVTLLLDPGVIVLAGGVAQAGAALIEPLRRRTAELLAWREAPELRTSTLGPEAGRIGAAVLAFDIAGREPEPASPTPTPAPDAVPAVPAYN